MLMASAFRVAGGGLGREKIKGEENKKQEGQAELFINRDVCLFGYRHYNVEHPKWF